MAIGRNEGALSQEGCRGPGVKVCEKRPSADCCTGTKLEQNYGRSEGEILRCNASGWQHFHLSIRPHILCSFTLCPLSQRQSQQAECLSAALCTHSIVPHFLSRFFHTTPPFSAHTHAACTNTRSLSLLLSHCLRVSLRRMSITAQGKEALIRGTGV